MTFGQKLKRWREGRELTQREAGELFGITSSQYAQWEHDYRRPRLRHERRVIELTGLCPVCHDMTKGRR